MDPHGGMSARDEGPDAGAAANPYAEVYSRRLTETLTELDDLKGKLDKAQAELLASSHVARSRDRAVEATVGPQGQLTKLQFLDNKHQSMSSTELAASVLEAVTQARDAMSRQVMHTMEPFTRSRLATMGSKGGLKIDWVDIFGPGVLEDPEDVTSYRSGDALRDEINEDGEE